MRANVYVDALNLYYGCLKGTANRWLDLGALCRVGKLPFPAVEGDRTEAVQLLAIFGDVGGARQPQPRRRLGIPALVAGLHVDEEARGALGDVVGRDRGQHAAWP